MGKQEPIHHPQPAASPVNLGRGSETGPAWRGASGKLDAHREAAHQLCPWLSSPGIHHSRQPTSALGLCLSPLLAAPPPLSFHDY